MARQASGSVVSGTQGHQASLEAGKEGEAVSESAQALADLKPGDPVRIVEHDDSTRQPKPGGLVLGAVVASTGGAYVSVRYDDNEYNRPTGTDPFYRESGWRAWDGEFCWRLFPGAAGDERIMT